MTKTDIAAYTCMFASLGLFIFGGYKLISWAWQYPEGKWLLMKVFMLSLLVNDENKGK
ncbi:hypothetical protein [Paraferrimonas sp. SM1919]|uniref:hypothetical protein n=1 Tax=Paraferrimonas sp. SM1919 TaxID=2662263 RepID=UPI0013D678F4|nr:hypothetical protein [Paraferrimonas sp. SM1919]